MHIAGDRGGGEPLGQDLLGDVEVQVASAVTDVEVDAVGSGLSYFGVDSTISVQDAAGAAKRVRDHVPWA